MTAPTYPYTPLHKLDILKDRPFTDVSLSADDLHSLRYIARRLHELIHGPEGLPDRPRPLTLEFDEPNGRYLRAIMCNTEVLKAQRDFYIVGFFGQKRLNADRAVIAGVDIALLGEFPAYPAVISYATLELEDGNFGNLVILGDDDGREHWRASTRHQYAVAELAPKYYASVRLHNGVLCGGLKVDSDIRLARTKYYDYENGFWCGLREME